MPLPALATYVNNHTATQVNHQSGLVAATISFNLPPGRLVEPGVRGHRGGDDSDLGMPASIHGSFAGAGQVYAQSMATMPLLILAALVAIYIVLGIFTRTPFIRSPSYRHCHPPASVRPWRCSPSARRFP